ncbi:MAG: glycosyltransferase [Planctomyces sp.]|nr:glycosyltransferase [Planctomyces sp.]
MNVLFLSMTFPDAGHRARGAYNLALCRALAQRHRVRVCAPRPWPEALQSRLLRRPAGPGPDVAAAGLQVDYPTYWYIPKLTQKQSGAALWQSCRGSVERLTRRFPTDVVLSYWAHPDGEAGLSAARRLGARSGVIVGGTDALILPHRPGRGPYVRRVLQQTDVVFTVSEGLRQAVLQLGAAPERVRVLSQGVDPEQFHPGDREATRRRLGLSLSRPMIVWVGRMVPVKRLDLLVEAVARLRCTEPDVELCLVGDGECRREVEQNVRRLKLEGVVRLVGAVPYHETAEWYRAADATVLSSDSEGLPNVLRESLACGTPFVSTNVGSVGEIAAPAWSRLVLAGDVDALADGLAGMLAAGIRVTPEQYSPPTWEDSALSVADAFAPRPFLTRPTLTRIPEGVA